VVPGSKERRDDANAETRVRTRRTGSQAADAFD
jgi:hypothetical protein